MKLLWLFCIGLLLYAPLGGCVFVAMGVIGIAGIGKAIYDANHPECEKAEGRCDGE